MMDLTVPDLKDSISVESLRRKLTAFGLNGKRYSTEFQTELQKYVRVRIHEDSAPEAYSWCQEKFEDNWTWSNPTQTDYVDIYFLHKIDAMIFKLTFKSLD